MPTGKITKLEPEGDEGEGYGYIQPDGGGPQRRFKESAVKGNGFGNLKEGDKVEYEDHLADQAKKVSKLNQLAHKNAVPKTTPKTATKPKATKKAKVNPRAPARKKAATKSPLKKVRRKKAATKKPARTTTKKLPNRPKKKN